MALDVANQIKERGTDLFKKGNYEQAAKKFVKALRCELFARSLLQPVPASAHLNLHRQTWTDTCTSTCPNATATSKRSTPTCGSLSCSTRASPLSKSEAPLPPKPSSSTRPARLTSTATRRRCR